MRFRFEKLAPFVARSIPWRADLRQLGWCHRKKASRREVKCQPCSEQRRWTPTVAAQSVIAPQARGLADPPKHACSRIEPAVISNRSCGRVYPDEDAHVPCVVKKFNPSYRSATFTLGIRTRPGHRHTSPPPPHIPGPASSAQPARPGCLRLLSCPQVSCASALSYRISLPFNTT